MTSRASLRGRVVLVTGASSGIGEATALACAREGMRVAVCARRLERLEGVAERCRAAGAAEVAAVAADVGRREDVERLVAAAEALGPVDGLVNNAGVGWNGRFEAMPADRVEALVAANLLGVLWATQRCLPGMLARRRGTIVNVGSAVGLLAMPYAAVYTATKYALTGFSHALRAELRHTGVQVATIFPATIETEFHRSAPLRSGASGRPASEVADWIVASLREPRRDVVDGALSLWRRVTDPVPAIGGRRDAALARALESIDPTLARRAG